MNNLEIFRPKFWNDSIILDFDNFYSLNSVKPRPTAEFTKVGGGLFLGKDTMCSKILESLLENAVEISIKYR